MSAATFRTPLCDLLGIEHPIFNVGFAAGARPDLAASVSNAGGCGVLGLSLPVDVGRAAIAATRELTSRTFGGNIIIASFDSPYASEEARALQRARVAMAFEERIPVLVLFWGDPAPFVGPAHAAGTKLLVQVGSPEEALAAARAGVDAVILQGIEAGGHVKATRSLWETLPGTVRSLGSVPVIASGGIGDGRAIARALALGAQGVSLGTRFAASEEAWVHPEYKRRLVAATAVDTEYETDLFNVGWREAPHRYLKNATSRAWQRAGRPPTGQRPGEGEPIGTLRLPWGDQTLVRYGSNMPTGGFEGDLEAPPMYAGQSVDFVKEIKPAAEIFRDLVRQTEAALAAMG